MEKDFFVLKMYDLTKTKVGLLANSSNHKAIFPEYSKKIPRISVSKIFQGYHRNIVRLQKCFYEVKNCKKVFRGLYLEIFNIGRQSPLLKCFSEVY